jgi:hypothetical protein
MRIDPPRLPKRKARSRPEPIALRIVLSLTRNTCAASRMVKKLGSLPFAVARSSACSTGTADEETETPLGR